MRIPAYCAALALALLVCAGDAHANGRPESGRTIRFRFGHESDVVVGLTFGLMISHDGGASWQWMCEATMFYGGMYDPFFAYAENGAIFATTNDTAATAGLHVNRDGCTFQDVRGLTALVALGSDGAIYVGAADDGKIYKSSDGGLTFPQSTLPGMASDAWKNIVTAPSDPMRVYASGVRFVGGVKTQILFASTNGGQTFQPLPVTDFMTIPASVLHVEAVSKTDPDVVFARIEAERDAASDGIYRSIDAGQHWQRILGADVGLSLVARANGDLVAATLQRGAQVSHDRGDHWTDLAAPPHIYCLSENSAGELWACTENYSLPAVPSDGAAVMKTVDLATWTPVMKFQDFQAPVACNAGTIQHDTCDAKLWCGLCDKLGCDPKRACPGFGADPPVVVTPKPGGCCDSGSGATTAMALGLVVGMVLWRRSRPDRRRHHRGF